jgi:hypothetical protein
VYRHASLIQAACISKVLKKNKNKIKIDNPNQEEITDIENQDLLKA